MGWFHDLLTDEDGQSWVAELLLTGVVVFAGWFTYQDVMGKDVGDAVYDFWKPLIITLVVWAGGTKMAPHLTPLAQALIARGRSLLGSSWSRTEVQERVDVDDTPGGKVG